MNKGLEAGRLRQRITYQAAVGTPDGSGGSTKAWSNLAYAWASVEPVNGGEVFKAGLLHATQFYKIEARFRSDITPLNRIMWKGVALNIRTCADPDGRRESLLIVAESGVAD
jgi:SPP1 family predicted phage head-tail adaptor